MESVVVNVSFIEKKKKIHGGKWDNRIFQNRNIDIFTANDTH